MEDIASIADNLGIKYMSIESPADAISMAISIGSGVVVTGSTYLVSEISQYLSPFQDDI